ASVLHDRRVAVDAQHTTQRAADLADGGVGADGFDRGWDEVGGTGGVAGEAIEGGLNCRVVALLAQAGQLLAFVLLDARIDVKNRLLFAVRRDVGVYAADRLLQRFDTLL